MNKTSPPTSADLNEQVAVVTGAAQGLGRAMAEELAKRGASVIIADCQHEMSVDAAGTFRQQGYDVSAELLDVAVSAEVDRFFGHVQATYGRLDILVNNAGVGQQVRPTVDLSDEEWQRVLGVTLTGTFYCCRAACRLMETQESGCIVNISSINGLNPAALVAAYNVAKAGVISLTRSLALEMAAYGVRVNAVCPGPVYTEFNRTVMAQRCENLNIPEEEMVDRIRGAIPLGRWGNPSDIAGAVAFLCSADASWMTGDVIRVSGGLEGVSAAPPKRKLPAEESELEID